MLDHIKLKFGPSSTKSRLAFDAGPVTIFVGPNNSGKSRILIELQSFCTGGWSPHFIIVEEIKYSVLTEPEKEISVYSKSPRIGQNPNAVIFGKRNAEVEKIRLSEAMTDPNLHPLLYSEIYASWNTIRLDGNSRMRLVETQKVTDLKAPPTNTLTVLLTDNTKRLEVRRILQEAFGKYFVVDPTSLGNLSIRFSDVPPASIVEEVGIHDESVAFHRKASDIGAFSDGVKAFTGIVTEIIAGDPKVVLLDEPEAFLHPALSAKLGKEVSNAMKGSFKNLFVSTHSSNFLMGCIQSGAPINIVRLTYSEAIPTARLLSKEKVLKLMRNPLLRSVGVLNGLFYEYVIVTEADSDRAFYQEINERLSAEGKGISNCLFLNAQNKQTVHEIVRPLREMGIPCAAIVDIDIVKEGGSVWSNFLSAANLPATSIQSLSTARSLIKNALTATGAAYKTSGGVGVLAPPDRSAANDLFDQLETYGLFVVRNGELESWLKPLEIAGHSPKWLTNMFAKLGEDPASGAYVKPGPGDVWEFVQAVKKWFTNTSRKGIPS